MVLFLGLRSVNFNALVCNCVSKVTVWEFGWMKSRVKVFGVTYAF